MIALLRSKPFWILLYLAAVLASHYFQAISVSEEPLPVGATSEESIVLAFEGAGGASESMRSLVNLLKDSDSVNVVEIGYNEVSGEQLREKLRATAPRKLYIAAEGYGAEVALSFNADSEIQVEKILLIEPVVSTRFELLGSAELNAALKAFQLAWYWVLDNATPHFGLLDRLPYNSQAATGVFRSDLERVGTLYESLDTPLVLAGSKDSQFGRYGLGPMSAVKPDAGVVEWEEMGSQVTNRLARELLDETDMSERSPEEIELRLADFPSARLGDLWAGSLLAFATFASEDLACIGGGLLAASGSITLHAAIAGCLLGIFIGDFGIYLIGRIFGLAALDIPIFRSMVSEKFVRRGSAWFEKRGLTLVILTRFLPGSRVPTYFAAGVVGVGWIRFAVALIIASAIWTPILVVASYFFGDDFLQFFESIGAGGWLGIVAAIVCFSIFLRIAMKLATWKGRRLLYSSWRRVTAFEFWPIWAVYLPVLVKIAWLAIRYRSVSLPFSVDPCMPASGLVYESKIQILEHLLKHGVPVARFEAIDLELEPEEKISCLQRFMEREGLDFPVVLKPDVGQRGQGVELVNSWEEAKAFFASQEEHSIAQEFISGKEFGVFYYRFAGSSKGVVSSITDKRMTFVTGDGVSTLERLILADERAVCMARFFLDKFETELDLVLADGERFELASIGTHSRGALFLDGASLITPELSEAVDAFSRNVDGFHFGRYDLKVPDEESLKRGEGIRVIELNGITSEPTNMYDPKHGALFGWKRLMHQWELIFALAKENRLAGHEPVSKSYVFRLAIGYWRGVASRSLS